MPLSMVSWSSTNQSEMIENYLIFIGLGCYANNFLEHGFDTFYAISCVSEDNFDPIFHSIGITKLGHKLALFRHFKEDITALLDGRYSDIRHFEDWLQFHDDPDGILEAEP